MKRLKLICLVTFSILLVGCNSTLDNNSLEDDTNVLAVEAEYDEIDPESEKDSTQYAYGDFIGYYLHYDSEDRAHADMIVTIGNENITIGWWNSSIEIYEILDKSINENVLTVEFSTVPYGEEDPISGTMEIYYLEENGEEKISFNSNFENTLYGTTLNEVENYGYTLQDDLLTDIDQ